MAFTTLILSRTLQTFAARSNTQTSVEAGFFSNKYVIGAVLVCLAFYGVAVLPGIREIFSIPDTFGMSHWLTATGLAVGAVILMELAKLIRRAFSPKAAESARA
ncbi:Calcium-transporting ATPase [compost metagenome]